jgi:hypothetical protein
MTDDNGNLSIDFLVGFTFFILAFIWVVSMIPGLLIGLQSYSIDYDAVAYRTGVILVEDPGWPASPPWESYNDLQKFNVTRFGMAISRDTPNILSEDKVNRFFCTTAFIYPDDYHQRAIFGDFPYHFQISLRETNESRKRVVGEQLPQGYGSIRRVVAIKGSSNATINQSYIQNHSYIKTDNVSIHVFSLLINNTKLLSDVRNPAYQIDSAREQLTINITDLKSTITEYPTAAPPITRATSAIVLDHMKIYKLDAGTYSNIPLPVSNYPYADGNTTRMSAFPATVKDNITIKLNPQYIDSMKAENSQIFLTLQFSVTPASTFLNNTQIVPDLALMDGKLTFENPNTTPFLYDYNPENVTQPKLRDAIVEIAVWSGETGLASAVTSIFTDDFDAVTAPAGWTLWGGILPERFTGTPHNGLAGMRIRDNPASMTRTISTAGYSGVTVSFEMGTQMSAGVFGDAEWSPDGGTTWNLLKRINSGDPEDDNDLHPFTFMLPAGADNNPAFSLRFAVGGPANAGDKMYLENVEVGGIAD